MSTSGSLLIAGSIASDHLMTFAGKFEDSLVVEQLHNISVSFLVEDLEIRRGGVAPNMCFGLGRLGLRPVLVGAAGEDFGDYRSWLERHNVDCHSVHISTTKHTARFVCTTDQTMAQFASFYPGAMSEARQIELQPIVQRVGEPAYVLIGADDPDAMRRHTHECRQRAYPFISDCSQQLAFSDGELIRDLIDGAAILFSNEYESHMIEQKTGWSAEEVLSRVGTQVTTLGAQGVRITREGEDAIEIAAAKGVVAVEPTGVGDAFRAGFLAGLSWELPLERAAQVGCVLAAYVVETVGTQEYTFTHQQFVDRVEGSYGSEAAKDVAAHL
ncbi:MULTISPECIES: carbohydrate kinase family protein [unclassified Nocardioides]|uniref:carbohydrate kinase family protein n=1 Tax=unclassified Nocardioides TaxID=2615069 RepID=UPI001E57399E|nr:MULTISPECIES: carbohydrate kinase family protein [unclassified Nocardioides]MCD4524921.1 carbohydrate kinase family protein [Nocardioides sp. cx-173]MCD4534662.1 carbohydrate kinase family protein [Nocardioides sp. cx-169]UGB43422.1 carbohydrate kinase family protein [Nocardioides sp. cx-173]